MKKVLSFFWPTTPGHWCFCLAAIFSVTAGFLKSPIVGCSIIAGWFAIAGIGSTLPPTLPPKK